MKRFAIFTVAAIAISAAALHADESNCTNQTIKGTFAVTIAGTRPAATVLPSVPGFPGMTEAVVGIAIQNFDGNGGFTQTDNVKGSLSGITQNRPGGGTYTVSPDCTGTYTVNIPGVPAPIVTRFVISDGGAAFTAVVVSPQPLMIAASGRRVN